MQKLYLCLKYLVMTYKEALSFLERIRYIALAKGSTLKLSH